MPASNIIGIPSDDKDFEENCVILFAGLLSDPNVKLVGTRGKAQSGLDITGRRDRDPNQPVGIQCKLITRGGKLTEKIIRDETKQALNVTPHLTEYIIVTTARDDPLYDEIATTISQEQAALGRKIDVQVWGWDTLEPKIRADKATLDAFDPGHSASTDRLIELGEESLQSHDRLQGTADQLVRMHEQTQAMFASVSPDAGRSDAMDEHLDAQVDVYRDILNSGKPKTALDLLEKLQDKLTENHSKAIRARVCANIGLAQQRLGDEKAAGELLLKAYEINPDDPKVATNRTLGLQLLGRFEESVEWAKARLEADPADEFAAGFMFQAATLMDDPPDPYQLVPADLLTNSTVRLYCCNFLRSAGRIEDWQDLAIQTWEDDPSDSGAARSAAEALLEKAIGDGEFERSSLLTSERLGYLKQAQELLQKAWDEARGFENADQNTYLVVGCNLVTAYRALKDYENAERIGNEMLAVNPNDIEARAVCVQVASDQNNQQKALELVEPLPDGLDKTSMILHIWSAIPDWQAILDYASDERRAQLNEKLKEQYDTMVFRAKHAHNETLNPALDADNLLKRWPESIAIHVAIADVYRRSDREKFEEVFEKARTLLSSKINFGHRAMFAHLSHLEERWDAVIEALDGYVAIDVETEPLARFGIGFCQCQTALPFEPVFQIAYAATAGIFPLRQTGGRGRTWPRRRQGCRAISESRHCR
ncbi:MAG: tetratricopeptide repeat protein [Parasphingorhabdus sp.]|uniref:tetratricopeptide repeat protein n=1 Tax=Parasphingorhabdus sp. TaxID=2709688 RepID=UPI00300237D8